VFYLYLEQADAEVTRGLACEPFRVGATFARGAAVELIAGVALARVELPFALDSHVAPIDGGAALCGGVVYERVSASTEPDKTPANERFVAIELPVGVSEGVDFEWAVDDVTRTFVCPPGKKAGDAHEFSFTVTNESPKDANVTALVAGAEVAGRDTTSFSSAAEVAASADLLGTRLCALDALVGSGAIGFVNRRLIAEWSGAAIQPPARTLDLGPPPGLSTSTRGGGENGALNDLQLDTAVDDAWAGNSAHRALWMRHLTGSPGASGLAQIRASLRAARECRHAASAASLIEAAISSSQLSEGRRRSLGGAAGRRRSSGDGQMLALMRAALVEAQHDATTVPPGGRPQDALRAAQAATAPALRRQMLTFRSSPEHAFRARLQAAAPSAASLADFTLIRRLGKGSYGEVYAARKEDTLALFALKVVHQSRVRTSKSLAHMRVERRVLDLAAERRAPFVCELQYAFYAARSLVLVMPLLSGGTLQVLVERCFLALAFPLRLIPLRARCISTSAPRPTAASPSRRCVGTPRSSCSRSRRCTASGTFTAMSSPPTASSAPTGTSPWRTSGCAPSCRASRAGR
jgi:hypothetical protein